MLRLLGVRSIALLLAGCSGMPDRDRNILAGAGAGAGVGALIGTAAGGPPGAWIGAAAGGITGGAIASVIRPEACYYRNKRGELWRVPCQARPPGPGACFVGNAVGQLEPVPCTGQYRW